MRYGDEGEQTGASAILHGNKLHLDWRTEQVPISAVLTSASVHDSRVTVPLMIMTS
jgi:hypothetical protein